MIENFGSNVARLRKEKNMTQKELADKLGVNKQTISNIEKGEGYPTFKNLEKLSQILNANAIQLFGTMKEIALSDTPKVLDRIDEYDSKIQSILKVEQFFNEYPIEEINQVSSSLHYLENQLTPQIITDNEGEPVFDKDGKFKTKPSFFDSIPFEKIEKVYQEIASVRNFTSPQLILDEMGEPVLDTNGQPIYGKSLFDELPFDKISKTSKDLNSIKKSKH